MKSALKIIHYLVLQNIKKNSSKRPSILTRMKLIGLHQDQEAKSTPIINPLMKMSSKVGRKSMKKFQEFKKRLNSLNKRKENLTFSLHHLLSRISLLLILI